MNSVRVSERKKQFDAFETMTGHFHWKDDVSRDKEPRLRFSGSAPSWQPLPCWEYLSPMNSGEERVPAMHKAAPKKKREISSFSGVTFRYLASAANFLCKLEGVSPITLAIAGREWQSPVFMCLPLRYSSLGL